jgi:hypothetical protein
MITLYSYPTLFGAADDNGYGLKVFASRDRELSPRNRRLSPRFVAASLLC